MPRRTLSGLFVGRSLSKWYLKRSSKALTITSKGRRTNGSSMEWDSVVLLSLAESSLKFRQTMAAHARYVLVLNENLMCSSRIWSISARHAFPQPILRYNILGGAASQGNTENLGVFKS